MAKRNLPGDFRTWFTALVVVVVLLGIWLSGIGALRTNYYSLVAALASLLAVLVGWKSLTVMQRQLDILKKQQDLLLRLPDVTVRVRQTDLEVGDGGVLEVPWTHSIPLHLGVVNNGDRPARDVYVRMNFSPPATVSGHRDVHIVSTQAIEAAVEGPVYKNLTVEFGWIQIVCPQETRPYRVTFQTMSEEGNKGGSLSYA